MKNFTALFTLTAITITLLSFTFTNRHDNIWDNNFDSQINESNSILTSSVLVPNPDYPVIIADNNDNQSVDFTFNPSTFTTNRAGRCCNRQAYNSSFQNRPNYNARNSWGFFTLFGDGNYSWASNPNHAYKTAGTYDHFFVEYTKIKDNGGKPPVAQVNPLFGSTMNVLQSNSGSMTNQNVDITNTKPIAFDQSRPLFCGYTFVQIIKVDPELVQMGVVEIEFNSSHIQLEQIVPYQGMPFGTITINPISPGGQYDTAISIPINSGNVVNNEIPIFVQFKTMCTTCKKDVCKGSLNVRVIPGSGSAPVEKKRDLLSQKNNPFDPNWLQLDHEICVAPYHQIHRMEGWFYFYEAPGTNSPRDVPEQLPQNPRSLTYKSCPFYPATVFCTELPGVGNTGFTPPLIREDALQHVVFDIVIEPNATGPIFLTFDSDFRGVKNAKTQYRIDLNPNCNDADTTYFNNYFYQP